MVMMLKSPQSPLESITIGWFNHHNRAIFFDLKRTAAPAQPPQEALLQAKAPAQRRGQSESTIPPRRQWPSPISWDQKFLLVRFTQGMDGLLVIYEWLMIIIMDYYDSGMGLLLMIMDHSLIPYV